jgi:hypothetical protein
VTAPELEFVTGLALETDDACGVAGSGEFAP